MKPAHAGFLLAALLLQNCEMSDDPFKTGHGKISGNVQANNIPVEGARVTRTGAPFDTPPAITSPDGNFLLEKVPASDQEIIIRAENQNKALRTHATVVSGHTSNLGTITLKDAVDLEFTVMDPDLPILEAKVRLEEIPTLEATTNLSGTTSIPCIPPTGTYTTTATFFPFEFLPATIAEDGRWNRSFLLTPDAGVDQTHAEVHHAYSQLQYFHQQIYHCSAECHVPAWWTWPGPPCPLPIGETDEYSSHLEDQLNGAANELMQLRRFTNGVFSNISCPQRDRMTVACYKNICILSLPNEIADAVKLASGPESMGCFDRYNLLATNKGLGINSILSCLDAENVDDVGPDELYVLYQLPFVVDYPRLVTALVDDTACKLYFEGDLSPTLEQSQVPEDDLPWVLYKLRFSTGSTPNPDQVEAHLSWINPLQ